jgi:hypothetical protein
VSGPVATIRFTGLPARVKDVQVWLPYNEITQVGALRTDAPVENVPQEGRRVWLHHGSSISHGSNAESPPPPGRRWPPPSATWN